MNRNRDDRTTVSLSQLREFEQCPYKYFKQYLDSGDAVRRQAVAVALSDCFRSCVEALIRPLVGSPLGIQAAILDVERATNTFAKWLFDEKLDSILYTRAEHPDQYIAKFREVAHRFNATLNKRLLNHRVHSGPTAITVSSGRLDVRTTVDAITQDPAGRYFLWMWKTGKVPRDDSDDQVRCLLVWHWARLKFGDNVVPRMVYLSRDDYWLSQEYYDHHVKFALNRVTERYAQIDSAKTYEPRQSTLCDWCEWRQECPLMQQSGG